MILYEQSGPAVRIGECDVGGRRAAARLLPYAGDGDARRWRFDVVERAFVAAAAQSRILVGPHDADAWRSALGRVPAGPLLIGPGSPAEPIHGAHRAAARAASESGRGSYLLDPDAAALPDRAPDSFVAVFTWSGGEEVLSSLEDAAGRGFVSGLLLPVIPGWSSDPELLRGLLEGVVSAGGRFVAPIAPRHDGEARRRIVEARGDSDGFFERIHHLDWSTALPASLAAVRFAVRERGLATLPLRPAGAAEPAANARAAARLEESAAAAADDHRFALLHAAARWIDESGRDLRAVLAEGNFRKVFPFAPEIASEAEEALREAVP
jgi:hypothetical protein